MQASWISAQAGETRVAVDPELGNLRAFEVHGREVLHTAHWVSDETPAQGVDLPVERKLAGDFFCAPFGGSGVDGVPAHGWTANSRWTLLSQEQDEATASMKFELDRDVFGARISKEIRLHAGHRAVYQTHEIRGGQGDLTFAHHPMLHMTEGGHLAFSAKRAAMTPATPLELSHKFKYPQEVTDLNEFKSFEGFDFDLQKYPRDSGHEDFATLIEAAESTLGWTAVTRVAEGDIVLFLKDPQVAPVTMLWYSNGGRDYAPWDGKHLGVLGVEDGCTAGAATLAQAAQSNPISQTGVATSIELGELSTTVVRHAIVSVACPEGWLGVADVCRCQEGTALRLTSLSGDVLEIPFDGTFFQNT